MKKYLWIGLTMFLALASVVSAANYGVFVGLNEYDTSYVDSGNWLSGCVPDANHVYTNAIRRGSWTTGTVTRLLNSAGSKTAIRRAISNYAAIAVSGDVFFYYHSSHGGNNSTSSTYGKSVFLCAYDDNYEDTEVAADLAKFATGVKVIVMVDACHSGGLFQSRTVGTRSLVPATETWDIAGSVMDIMADNRAKQIAAGVKGVEKTISTNEIGWITAANYDQYSWDGDDGGLFTSKVIEGWTNPVASSCDLNSDGYANFWELYKYASNVAYSADYEYTTAMAANTNVLLGTIAGWIGSAAPGGLVVFSNIVAQTVVVGQTLDYPVGAYTSGTNTPVVVTMTTVQAGASYASGRLTFTPTNDGTYTFNFSATNATGGSATASVTVNAALAAPVLSAASSMGNDHFTANWSAVTGAASYRLDVATNNGFSAGGSGSNLVEEGFASATPSGWTISAGGTYSSAPYIGTNLSGTYSIKFSATGNSAVTPAFATGATNLQFWAFGNGGSGSTFAISGLVNSVWTLVDTKTIAQSGAVYRVTLDPATTQIGFYFTRTYNCALDDVIVQAPAGSSSFVPGYQNRTVAGTSQSVTGLTTGATYYYRVKAVGNATGLSSTTGTVTTTSVDAAPAFAAISGQSATVGALFTLNVSGYVSGSPAPVISLSSSSASASDYSFASPTLSFTPSTTGVFAFVFRATNSLGTAMVTANVTAVSAPVYVPTASIANLSSNSFTVNWTAITSGTTYQVQVATDNLFTARATARDVLISEDFTDYSDWTDGGTSIDTTNSHYGAASPCRALGTNDTLTSPAVNYPTQLVFHADASSGGNNKATTNYYSLDGGASWLPIGTFTVNTAGVTVVQALTSSPNLSGATNVLFRFVSAFNTWYLDDVSVTGGTGGGGGGSSIVVDQTVAALTYPVSGLTPATLYYVRVRGTGGTWSEMVSATTTDGSGGATPAPVDIVDVVPPANGAAIAMQIPTSAGITYALQYTTNLLEVPPVWVQVDSETGTGGAVSLQDADSAGLQRYYRVVKP